MKHDIDRAVDRVCRHVSNTAFIVLVLVWLKDSETAKEVFSWWPVLIPAFLVGVVIAGNLEASTREKRARADPAAWRKWYGYDD